MSLNEKYGLKQVINASGRMSVLGVSAPSDTVMDAMKIGGQNYVEFSDLVTKSGQYIANILGAEASIVVNSASSGIALSIAGMITEGKRNLSEKIHQVDIAKNEIIMFKGHNVDYGAPIETAVYLGGGKVVEVGYANAGKIHHIEDAINENTAAILYVKSHHAVQKNMVTVEETWEFAKANNIPLIVDAAAEEDLKTYIEMSDLVIYSGAKAIEGPTSGIVAGKQKYVDWVNMQFNYIGRSMKVGKEMIFGLLQAMDEYFEKDDQSEEERESLQTLLSLNDFEGVRVEIIQDEAGRAIFRARVHIDSAKRSLTASEVVHQLQTGEIAIYIRDHNVNQGFFDIDPRPLKDNELDIIKSRLQSILGEN